MASGKVCTNLGYLEVLKPKNVNKQSTEKAQDVENSSSKTDVSDENNLEVFKNIKKGQEIETKNYEIKDAETSPPSRYNSGSIILAMENAGKLIEEEELREQIKGAGIGTSATRGEIIKKLERIKYIDINSKTQSDEINEPLSFKPVMIEENGCKCIPLFTDNEELKKDNPPVSVIAIFMKDLKDMLEDSSEIDEIMINPSSKDTVCIDLDSFFDLFEVRNNPNDWIFEKAMPLNQEIRVYYRELEPFMKKQAVNGVYSSPDPLKASVNMHFDDNIPYLNVLILPKDTNPVCGRCI